MKILYFDLNMGAAGDMLAAALTELLPDPEGFVKRLNALNIPGVEFVREPSEKCGILGTHMSVRVNGEEEHEHHHDHDHGHHHEHHHSDLGSIGKIVEGLDIPENVKKDVMAVYLLIAEAESAAHGREVTEIHFHEVGTMDAVADVTAVCLLMNEIKPDAVFASPVHVGAGQVRCAHGILPVPAPATAYILRDVPIYGGAIRSELCTPTGAALIRRFVSRFGDMPVMRVEKIGLGMGKKDFEAANCVRAMLGESEERGGDIVELKFNVDDMTGEEVGFLTETLFENGALEVFDVPVSMKKSRPGTMMTVLIKEEDREKLLKLIFRHSSTLGVREYHPVRHTLSRRTETVDTRFGGVRMKVSEGFGVTKTKYEYEDLARIARETGMSLPEVRKAIDEREV
ncbi:MAG: nickel pincer cofactor biosynthesis protein LarC [Clostridiales bacterium]|nr:nickel pincer cofactor biosynthesis protein LarC [Clostridiales bacterium]